MFFLLKSSIWVASSIALSLSAHADDCELLSITKESKGIYCCKTEGTIERECFLPTSKSCEFEGQPGTIKYCEIDQASSPRSPVAEQHTPDPLGGHSVGQMAPVTGAAERSVEASDYSINLMWINQNKNPSQGFLSSNNPEDEKKKLLTHIAAWAAANPGSNLNLWYDSEMTTPEALDATQRLLREIVLSHPQWAQVHFKDIRVLPEVNAHPEVFTPKTPVYFRVDLLRAIAIHHTLQPGRQHYFVYADLDVAPLSKEEIFDSKTLRKMNEFGFVMADGGIDGYENSFQMFSNHKPNLMKAMKEAIIDINIKRAENILAGGCLRFNQRGDTRPLEQKVYESYKAMAPYYYHLENWGKATFANSEMTVVEGEIDQFGINDVYLINIEEKILPILNFNKRMPTKIIDAPRSQFGGRPTVFDPYFINSKNYPLNLHEYIKRKGHFNGKVFIFAVRTNHTDGLRKIVEALSPEDLKRELNILSGDSWRPETSLEVLISNKNHEILDLIFEKLSSQGLVEELAQSLKSLGKVDDLNTAEVLMNRLTGCSNYAALMHSLAGAVIHIQDPHVLSFFQRISEKIPSLFEERTPDGESFILKAVKQNQEDLVRFLTQIAPQSLTIKDKEGNSPLFLSVHSSSDLFETVLNGSREMLTDKNLRGMTVAHLAAEKGDLSILRVVAQSAPDLWESQDAKGNTPAWYAACTNLETFEFVASQLPRALSLRNLHGWTPADIAANRGDADIMAYLIKNYSQFILSDFSRVVEKATVNNPNIVLDFARAFPEKLSEIIETVKKTQRAPDVVSKLEEMESRISK